MTHDRTFIRASTPGGFANSGGSRALCRCTRVAFVMCDVGRFSANNRPSDRRATSRGTLPPSFVGRTANCIHCLQCPAHAQSVRRFDSSPALRLQTLNAAPSLSACISSLKSSIQVVQMTVPDAFHVEPSHLSSGSPHCAASSDCLAERQSLTGLR